MKRLFFSILMAVVVVFPLVSFANPPTSQFTPPLNPSLSTLTDCTGEDCYTLLEPLPQKQEDGTYKYIESFNTSATGSDQGIGGFLNFIFQIAIGIAGVLGVVMLTVYGFQYAAQDKNINTLSDLRTKITNVIFGILLLLGIFIILRTINPDLLIVEPRVDEISLDSYEPGSDGGYSMKTKTKASSNNDLSWVKSYGKALKLKDRSTGQPILVKPCEPSQNVAIQLFGRNFTVHKGTVASLKRIEAKWKAAGGNSFYKIPASSSSASAMAAYSCRTIAGSSTLSWHSYGLAIDINPLENPHQGSLKTNMPAAFVKMWTDEGWGWGGRWNSSKDAMHFSKIRNEGGDMILD